MKTVAIGALTILFSTCVLELLVHRNYLLTYRIRDGEIEILQVWHVARHR